MSRKKTVTITRKPIAQGRPIPAAAAETANVSTDWDGANFYSSISSGESAGAPFPEQRNAFRRPTGVLGKALYSTVYGMTYGIVYGVMSIGTILPGNKIVGNAMVDATVSARRTFHSRQQSRKTAGGRGLEA